MGCIVEVVVVVVVATGAGAGAGAASCWSWFSSSCVMIPFFTRSRRSAWLVSAWAIATPLRARAHPRSAVHFVFLGSMGIMSLGVGFSVGLDRPQHIGRMLRLSDAGVTLGLNGSRRPDPIGSSRLRTG